MLPLRILILLLLTSLTLFLDAQSPGRRRAVTAPDTGLEIYPLAGFDPNLPTDDLAPFGTLVGDASVVGIGEGWHTSGGFYMMKHRLFRYLVQEKGFRAFAIESDWEAVERTNTYVQSCAGTAESAISDEIVVWQSTEYADLIRWMCQWNSAHPDPADKLNAFGFDIQQPDKDGPALDAFMRQLGVPQSDARLQGLKSCELAFGLSHPFGEIPPAVHATCVDSLDGIESFLQANRTAIVESTSQYAFDIAMLRVVGLRANQQSVFYIRDDFAKGFNYRDVGMAYTFQARRAMVASGAKTMAWGDNVHVAQNLLPDGEVGMGKHLEDALGDDYVSFGLTAYETEVPKAPGACGFAARRPGAVEERLVTYGHETLLARPRDGVRQYEVMPMGFFTYRPFADFEAVFFIAHSPAMHALFWPYCR
jgi:erythromycin esterase-like protein